MVLRNVQEAVLQEKVDPYLTEANLSALAAEALGTKCRCNAYTVLTGGLWNRVIAASVANGERQLVIKVSPKVDDDGVRREFAVLRYFRTLTSLPVPEPYLFDVSGRHMPGSVLVMEKVPGTVLQEACRDLGDADRAMLSEEIANHLADLHTRQEAGFGPVELPSEKRPVTWPDFWLPRFDEVVAETAGKGYLAAGLLAELRQVRGRLPQLLDIGPRGTLTHYDVWTGNVMVDFRAGRPYVSAFLDLLGYYADYARELSAMFGLADQRFMQVYAARHGLDETFAARVDIYSFKMCLQLVCMYPSEPSHMASARQFLRRVQTFLEDQ